MVKKYEKLHKGGWSRKQNIKADVIILGCSLPGIVTAHKLKKRFGDSMNIVVLDVTGPGRKTSKANVAFQGEDSEDDEDSKETEKDTRQYVFDNFAIHYLAMYSKDFNIPLPDAIISPEKTKSRLNKLFEYRNGQVTLCANDYNDFDYLRVVERFELTQYQTLLDEIMRDLFLNNRVDSSDKETKKLLYYDQTTMEQHICGALLFHTTREIMRTTVKLVCGVSADKVSLLFYMHQCYRTSSARNHLDGHNTRLREKLLGYCRKHLTSKLQKSIEDITITIKPVMEIRTYSDEEVILETIKGETNYVCHLLAMALRPDELYKIQVETQLLTERAAVTAGKMTPGQARKFQVQYEDNFWREEGYSGDILSIKGPIIWAMERPKLTSSSGTERYSALVGYLMVRDDETDSKSAVLEQLVRLFGEEASSPVHYKETDISDIYIPRCGDFVALHRLTEHGSPRFLEWGTLDVFADGDVAAALEAGHTAFLHLCSCLRPQAQTFEDLSVSIWPSIFTQYTPLDRMMNRINIISSLRLVAYTTAMYFGLRLIQSYFRRSAA